MENSTTSVGVLKDKAPTYIQELLEKRLGGSGLDLHDVAVFASAIEHLVHSETVKKLGAAFEVYNFLPTQMLTESEADQILDTYMTAFILGENLTTMSEGEARTLIADMPEVFGHWSETKQFVQNIRDNLTKSLSKSGRYLSFAVLAQVAEEVGENFGTFQNVECGLMKDKLLQMEVPGTGRVKLTEFYKPGLNDPDGAWHFTESVAYLRQLGALDESNPEDPGVMVANYLHASNNCIASSGFYSVCCKDECESLFGHLEERISASEVKPDKIVQLVKNLASSTVTAPRELSETLLKRLDDIAAMHGGKVQLHGRLFAQWMHHAFPHECPYPHLSGTVFQQSPDEFEESGNDVQASNEEMRQFTESDKVRDFANGGDLTEAMLWTPEEELLVERSVWSPVDNERRVRMPPALQSLALVAAAGSLSLMLVRSLSLSSDLDGGKNSKLFV